MLDDDLLHKQDNSYKLFYKAALYSYLFSPALFIIGTFPLIDLHFLRLLGIFSVIPTALIGIVCAVIGTVKQRKSRIESGKGILLIALGVLMILAGFAVFGLLFAAFNLFS